MIAELCEFHTCGFTAFSFWWWDANWGPGHCFFCESHNPTWQGCELVVVCWRCSTEQTLVDGLIFGCVCFATAVAASGLIQKCHIWTDMIVHVLSWMTYRMSFIRVPAQCSGQTSVQIIYVQDTSIVGGSSKPWILGDKNVLQWSLPYIRFVCAHVRRVHTVHESEGVDGIHPGTQLTHVVGHFLHMGCVSRTCKKTNFVEGEIDSGSRIFICVRLGTKIRNLPQSYFVTQIFQICLPSMTDYWANIHQVNTIALSLLFGRGGYSLAKTLAIVANWQEILIRSVIGRSWPDQYMNY